MYESNSYGIHRNFGAVVAAAIVAISGLVFDQAHLAAAPAGTVDIGQLTLIEASATIAALPAVIVSAPRLAQTVAQGRA